MAVPERVDGVDAREQKRYKNSFLHPTVLVPCVADVEELWPLNAKAPRLEVANPPNDNGVLPMVKWGGVSPGLIVGIGKAGYGITKALGIIKPSEPRKYPKNADGKWTNPMHVANPIAMQVNRSIVLSCENV